MAMNPLGRIGAGLAKGAGNFSALMMADRLKREAEARALSSSQALAGDEFGRRKLLQEMMSKAAMDRQVSSNEATIKAKRIGNRQVARSGGSSLGVLDPWFEHG
jgi:hypothetical protein